MKLHTVQRGILSLDGVDFTTTEKPIVIVHPYFNERARSKLYISAINILLEEYKGPVITLETEYSLNTTAQKYADIGRSKNTFFIKTEPCDCDPVPPVTWDQIVDFLKIFQGKPVGLAGGRYTGILNPNNGCLSATGFELKNRDIDLEVMYKYVFR